MQIYGIFHTDYGPEAAEADGAAPAPAPRPQAAGGAHAALERGTAAGAPFPSMPASRRQRRKLKGSVSFCRQQAIVLPAMQRSLHSLARQGA